MARPKRSSGKQQGGGDGIYDPRRPPRLTAPWTCCDIKLGETLVNVQEADDRVLVHVQPYAQMISEDPAFPSKFQLICPTCRGNTVMGLDHPGMVRTRQLGAAYRAGPVTEHTWVGDLRTMATRPAAGK